MTALVECCRVVPFLHHIRYDMAYEAHLLTVDNKWGKVLSFLNNLGVGQDKKANSELKLRVIPRHRRSHKIKSPIGDFFLFFC